MKKLIFISILAVFIGICFTVSAFADFYVIPVQKKIERVPKTGQTNCWNSNGSSISCDGTGQDGEYQIGFSPAMAPSALDGYTIYGGAGTRFTDNDNGTVTDNITGLVWLKQANYKNTSGETGITNWQGALDFCNALHSGQCGLTDGSSAGDWRLPNFNELRSLVDPSGESNPTLPDVHPFTNVQSNLYWTSTTYEGNPPTAFCVYMRFPTENVNGVKVNSYAYGFPLYAWPVRSDN